MGLRLALIVPAVGDIRFRIIAASMAAPFGIVCAPTPLEGKGSSERSEYRKRFAVRGHVSPFPTDPD
jgi:hypothetical protein